MSGQGIALGRPIIWVSPTFSLLLDWAHGFLEEDHRGSAVSSHPITGTAYQNVTYDGGDVHLYPLGQGKAGQGPPLERDFFLTPCLSHTL